jgi:hypothetical protein
MVRVKTYRSWQVSSGSQFDSMYDDKAAELLSTLDCEFQALIDRHDQHQAEEFNEDEVYKSLTVEAISAKSLALKKSRLFLERLNGGASEIDLTRILQAPFQDFESDWIELHVSTGVKEFPWHEAVSTKPMMDLGGWTPDGLEEWQLKGIRQVISQREIVTSVCIGSAVLPFPDGLMAESIKLDAQFLRDVIKTLAFLLTVNTGLVSLSLR